MSNMFLQHYGWRSGTRLEADPTLVGREIDALGGELAKRSDLIAAGIGGAGELAKCFTQDRDEAAQKRWISEADYVMRSLIPIVIDTVTEEEVPIDRRIWLPVYTETNQPADAGMYRRLPIEIATEWPKAEKPDKQLEGWAALMTWRDKYGDDPLYAPVVTAIDSLRD